MPPLVETVSAAVTPVVLVSASALLVSGIGNKHQNMSDRVRELNAEKRSHNVSTERRASIDRQIDLLSRRIRNAAIAHVLLYMSIVVFMTTVLLVLLAPAAVTAGLALLISGISLVLISVVFEIFELRLANRTLRIEVQS